MQASDLLALDVGEAARRIDQLIENSACLAVPILAELAVRNAGPLGRLCRDRLDAAVLGCENLRATFRHDQLSRWGLFEGDDVVRLLHKHSRSFGLAVVASFGFDGYVREAATRNLVALGDPYALPFLMFRACDWVTPIARLASRAAQRQILNSSDEALRNAFPAMMYVGGRVEADAAMVSEAYRRELLTRQELLPSIRRRGIGREIRWLLAKAMIAPSEDLDVVLRAAIRSKDPSIVVASIRSVRSLPWDGQEALIEDLLVSPSPVARLEAVTIADRIDRIDVLLQGVLDSHWRVRNDSRFYLEKRNQGGFAALYRERLPLPAAVAGFGEVAPYKELAELIPYVSHESSSVRREAIFALGRREFQPSGDAILDRLSDPSARVARSAVTTLSALHVSVSADLIEELLDDLSSSFQGRRVIEGALELVPRWERLLIVLKLIPRGALFRSPSSLIGAWLDTRTRDSSGPTTDQCSEALQRLNEALVFLHPDTAQALSSEVEYWAERLHVPRPI